jgi:hypothetical protein
MKNAKTKVGVCASPKKVAILEELRKTKFVENYAAKLCRQDELQSLPDYVQELWVMICQLDGNRVRRMYARGGINEVRKFVSAIVYQQIHSDNSIIHHTYRSKQEYATDFGFGGIKDDDDIVGGESVRIDDTIFLVKEVQDKLQPIEAYIFNTWLECDRKIKITASELNVRVDVANGVIKRILKNVSVIMKDNGYNFEDFIACCSVCVHNRH